MTLPKRAMEWITYLHELVANSKKKNVKAGRALFTLLWKGALPGPDIFGPRDADSCLWSLRRYDGRLDFGAAISQGTKRLESCGESSIYCLALFLAPD